MFIVLVGLKSSTTIRLISCPMQQLIVVMLVMWSDIDSDSDIVVV